MFSWPKLLLLTAVALPLPVPVLAQSAAGSDNFLSASAPPGGWPKYPQTLPDAAQLHAAGPTVPADLYGYGTTPTPAQIAGWDIDVRPDGQVLPLGKGNVSDGANIFAQKCAMCHGTFGEGENAWPALANGSSSLTGAQPSLTVGNYWPFATTLYDYINRAMPYFQPHSLKPDEVYAISAYILNLNNIVPDSFVADQSNLARVKMPNRHGFIWKDPRPDTHDKVCMSDCTKLADVKITSSAEGKPLTPATTGPLDEMKPK